MARDSTLGPGGREMSTRFQRNLGERLDKEKQCIQYMPEKGGKQDCAAYFIFVVVSEPKK